MGNGNEIWELFGHDALLIHDNVSGRDTVFNWGVFDFRQPNFIAHFLMASNALRHGQRFARLGDVRLPIHESPGALPGARPHAGAARHDPAHHPGERAAGKHQLPVRLLPQQLRDARARHHRPGARRSAVRAVADADRHDVPVAGAAAHAEHEANRRRRRHRTRTAVRPRAHEVGDDVSPEAAPRLRRDDEGARQHRCDASAGSRRTRPLRVDARPGARGAAPPRPVAAARRARDCCGVPLARRRARPTAALAYAPARRS